MRSRFTIVILFALSSADLLHADELLDAKLDALKKKTQRRDCSEIAVLDEQNLTVPKEITEEEKALDAKIRAMEREVDVAPIGIQRSAPQRIRRAAQPEQDEPANWLTPALLSDTSKEDASSEEDPSWIMAELTRQEEMKEEARQKEQLEDQEKRMLEQRLETEKLQRTRSSFAPANSYSESLRTIISGTSPAAEAENNIPRIPGASSSPLQMLLPDSKKQSTSDSALPSFLYRSSQSSKTQGASSSSERQEQNLSPLRRSLPGLSTQPAEQKESEQIRKRTRPTTPGQDSNPFEDEWVPAMKTSIWD